MPLVNNQLLHDSFPYPLYLDWKPLQSVFNYKTTDCCFSSPPTHRLLLPSPRRTWTPSYHHTTHSPRWRPQLQARVLEQCLHKQEW